MAKRIITLEVDDEILTREMGTARTKNIDTIRRNEFGRSMRELLMQEQYADMNRDAASHLNMFFGVTVVSDKTI